MRERGELRIRMLSSTYLEYLNGWQYSDMECRKKRFLENNIEFGTFVRYMKMLRKRLEI